MEWTCSLCDIVNRITKKERCSKCGIKRACGEARAPSAQQALSQPKQTSTPPPGVQTVSSIRMQILEVQAQVQALTPNATTPVGTPPSAPILVSAEVTTDRKKTLLDTKAAKAKIAKYTLQLEQLDEEDEDMRPILHAKIENIKATIVEAKPIGQRIDESRSFLERAQARGRDAATALQAAEAAVVAATAEIDRATA